MYIGSVETVTAGLDDKPIVETRRVKMNAKEAIVTAATAVEAIMGGPINGTPESLAGLRQDFMTRNTISEIQRGNPASPPGEYR